MTTYLFYLFIINTSIIQTTRKAEIQYYPQKKYLYFRLICLQYKTYLILHFILHNQSASGSTTLALTSYSLNSAILKKTVPVFV